MNMADKSSISKRHGKKRNMQRKREIPDDLFRTRTSKDLESEVNLKDVLCNDIPVKPPRRSMILRAFKQNVVSSTPKPVRGARGFSWDISTIDNTASSSSKPISISSTTDCQCENQADEEAKTSRQHNNKENSNKTGLNTPKNQQSPPKPAPRTTYTREKQTGLQVPSADKLCIAKGQQRSSSRDGISKLTSPHRSPRQSPQVLAPDKSCEDEDQRRSMAKEGISKTFHDSPKSSQRHALQMLTPTKNCVDKDQKRSTAEGVISKTSFNDSPRSSRKRTNARAEHSVQTSECREDDFQEIIAEAPMMPNVSRTKRKMDLAEQAVQTSLADDTGDKITRPDSTKHLVQKSSSGTSLRQSAVPDSEVVEEIPANKTPSRRSSNVKRKESYLHLLYEPVTDADIALSDICYEDLDVGKAKPWRFSVSPKEVLGPMRDLTAISDAVDESEVEDSVQKDACIDLRENEDVFIKPKSMRARRTFANFRNSHLTCSNLTGNTASYLSDRPDEAYRRPSTLSREGSKQEPEKTEKIRKRKEGWTPTPEKPDEVRKQKEGSTPTPEKPDEVRKQKGKGKSTDIPNKRTAHMSPGTSSCQGTGENRILKELASLRAKSTRDPEEPKERELMNESGYSCGCASIGSPDIIRATYGRTGLCGEPISGNDILQMCPRVASIALPGLDPERVKLQLQQCEPKISEEVHLIHNSEMKDIKVVHRLDSTTTFTELQRNISRSKCLGIVDGVTTSDIKIPPGATKPLAKINNRLLIYIVLEGYGRAQIHSSIACIQPTDRIIIPCGVPYSITNGSKEKDLILNCLKIESHDIMSCTL